MYKEDMTAHQWTPPVPPHLQHISNERQWLLLGRKVAFLHIYVACQTSRNNDFIEWNEHLFELVTQEAISKTCWILSRYVYVYSKFRMVVICDKFK